MPGPIAASTSARGSTRLISRSRDAFGVAWVVLAAVAVLIPALVHGASLGPLDWVSGYGFTHQSGVVVHDKQNYDLISEMIPWTTLAWTQVHHGQLPLWNPYSALGMPLAFNWQSATFSVPSLIGYLFPLRLAYTVGVMMTLVIAGTGAYVLGRVLGLGVVACAMTGVVFELSGAFASWLGWPVASVMAWAGWLFAAALLVIQGRRRARHIALFAVVLACAIYAGQPDMLVLLGVAFLVFAVVLLGLRSPQLHGSGPIFGPIRDLALAGVAGAALGAPLLYPGLQLAGHSVRGINGLSKPLPLSDATHLLFQGFDGLPVAGSQWFGPSYYVRTAIYIGVIALVLATLAVGIAVRNRRRSAVTIAFAAVALAMLCIIFFPVVESVLEGIPGFKSILWRRATEPLALAIAVLAGIGIDALVRSQRGAVVRAWAARVFGAAGVVVLAIWLFGRGHLPQSEAQIRSHSFIWPVIGIAVGLVVVGLLVGVAPRRSSGANGEGRIRNRVSAGALAGACLLVTETAFLIFSGAPVWSSSPTYLKPTAAVTAYQRAVGTSLVGFGSSTCFKPGQELGIVPDVNDVYGVREMAVYDPLFQRAYYQSWLAATGEKAFPKPAFGVPFALYCPAVNTVAAARLFGVQYVLEAAGDPGPPGAVFDTDIGGEKLFRIPDSAPATVTPLTPSGGLPAANAPGAAVKATYPDPATWRMVTSSAVPAALRLRLTDLPGWHATIDGRPLPLQVFEGVMLEARVPAGHHVIEVQYWPPAFTDGLVLAGVAVLGLVGGLVAGPVRRRRRVTR